MVSVSPQIEVANVELLNAPYPGYRITLRNLGSKGVSNDGASYLLPSFGKLGGWLFGNAFIAFDSVRVCQRVARAASCSEISHEDTTLDEIEDVA